MPPAPAPTIAEVTRPYSGQEGFRVKAGTRLAVGKPVDGLKVITEDRYNQLLKSGLARPFGAQNGPLSQTPPPRYEGQIKPMALKPPANPQGVGQGAAKRRQQEAKPAEPRPLENPAGGETGAGVSASSSPADPASTKSTSKLRGARRSRSSQSTTRTKNAGGQKPSTPATADGGASTKDAKNSAD